MEVSVTAELRIFVLMLGGGALCGFLYDLFRILRRVHRTGGVMTVLQDSVYWLVNIFLVFGLILYANDGSLRWYVFFALLAGVVLYELLLSKWVISFSVVILNFFKKVLKILLKIIFYPVFLVYRVLYRPISFLKKKISEKIRKIQLTGKQFCFKIKRVVNNIRKMKKK